MRTGYFISLLWLSALSAAGMDNAECGRIIGLRAPAELADFYKGYSPAEKPAFVDEIDWGAFSAHYERGAALAFDPDPLAFQNFMSAEDVKRVLAVDVEWRDGNLRDRVLGEKTDDRNNFCQMWKGAIENQNALPLWTYLAATEFPTHYRGVTRNRLYLPGRLSQGEGELWLDRILSPRDLVIASMFLGLNEEQVSFIRETFQLVRWEELTHHFDYVAYRKFGRSGSGLMNEWLKELGIPYNYAAHTELTVAVMALYEKQLLRRPLLRKYFLEYAKRHNNIREVVWSESLQALAKKRGLPAPQLLD